MGKALIWLAREGRDAAGRRRKTKSGYPLLAEMSAEQPRELQ
jgi:hypothetical protein